MIMASLNSLLKWKRELWIRKIRKMGIVILMEEVVGDLVVLFLILHKILN